MTYPFTQDVQGKRVVTLDIETYYDSKYSLRKLDYMDYINNEEFELINAAVSVDNTPAQLIEEEADLREYLIGLGVEEPGVITVAHNARFETTYLSQRLSIKPAYTMCTQCMARGTGLSRIFGESLEKLTSSLLGGEKNIAPMLEALKLGSLDDKLRESLRENIAVFTAAQIIAGKPVNVPEALQIMLEHLPPEERGQVAAGKRTQGLRALARKKSKSVVEYGVGKRKVDMTPGLLALYGIYVRSDVDSTKQLFDYFAPLLSHREARTINMTMRAYFDPRMTIDGGVARVALEEELAAQEAIVESAREGTFAQLNAEQLTKFVRSRVAFPYVLAGMLGISLPPLEEASKNLAETIYHGIKAYNESNPAKPIPEFVTIKKGAYSMELSKDGVLNDYIVENYSKDHIVRKIWLTKLTKASTLTISRLERFADKGDRYEKHPGPLEYGSAHTLRFGGADKLNFQNLAKGGALRAAVQALPGRALVSADSSQIEPRAQGVICNDRDILQVFASGSCIYIHTASSIFGTTPEALIALKDTDPDEYKRIRNIGKVARLSLGYAMGAKTFGRRGELWGIMFADTIEGHYEEAQRITRAFRKSNPAITRMWSDLETAFSDAIEGRWTRFGGLDGNLISIYKEDIHGVPTVVMEIPGVRMMYPRLRWQWDELREREQMMYDRIQQGRLMTESLYGGKALENVTQALAACVIKEQGIAVEDTYNYPFVFNVHDENITEVAIAHAPTAAANIVELMCIPPSWAPELPLGAEAVIGKSFMGSWEYSKGGGFEKIKDGEEKYNIYLGQ